MRDFHFLLVHVLFYFFSLCLGGDGFISSIYAKRKVLTDSKGKRKCNQAGVFGYISITSSMAGDSPFLYSVFFSLYFESE